MQTFDTAIFDGNQDPSTQGDFIFDTEFVILSLWLNLDHKYKRILQLGYSKFLKKEKYGTTQDSLAKKAKQLYDLLIA